jgi:hypothetical protein
MFLNDPVHDRDPVALVGMLLKFGYLKPGIVNELLAITITSEHLYCHYVMYRLNLENYKVQRFPHISVPS